jgi:hypothetical protein
VSAEVLRQPLDEAQLIFGRQLFGELRDVFEISCRAHN